MRESLERLARLAGIALDYHDAYGNLVATEEPVLLEILKGMRILAEDEIQIQESTDRLLKLQSERLLDCICIKSGSREIEVNSLDGDLSWTLKANLSLENGSFIDACEYSGSFFPENSNDAKDRETKVKLERELPAGYYCLTIQSEKSERTLFIVSAPEKCFGLPDPKKEQEESEEYENSKRTWGFTLQLYSLLEDSGSQIGDFDSLQQFCRWAIGVGADFVGLNPLLPTGTQFSPGASPYSPLSRFAINELYISIERVIESLDYEGSLKDWGSDSNLGLIDYAVVFREKYHAYSEIYGWFCQANSTEKTDAFRSFQHFIENAESELQHYVCFRVKEAECFYTSEGEDSDVRGGESRDFLSNKANYVEREFYYFLQWLAEEQLSQCCNLFPKSKIGLYQDFPVGVATVSADVSSRPELFAENVSIGAPPDLLAPQGQCWGLPPMIPARMLETACESFVKAIRFAMKHAGALRLDHVMSLERLFWVTESGGAYVSYPFEVLCGIVRLESQRAKCRVIGEDLGTVADSFRERMASAGIYSYKVAYFEKDGEGNFSDPMSFSKQSLITASTHDLPTIRGFFSQSDLQERKELKLHDPEVLEKLVHQRVLDISQFRSILGLSSVDDFEILVNKFHRYILNSSSEIVAIQLDDLLFLEEQVNLPGTVDERANWRRKLPESVKDILCRDTIFL